MGQVKGYFMRAVDLVEYHPGISRDKLVQMYANDTHFSNDIASYFVDEAIRRCSSTYIDADQSFPNEETEYEE